MDGIIEEQRTASLSGKDVALLSPGFILLYSWSLIKHCVASVTGLTSPLAPIESLKLLLPV